MKVRVNPKVHNRQPILFKREKVGYIQLVSYMTGGATPHIEFAIDEPYRNKGIMTKELPKYLKYLKKWGHYQLIAIVKCDNQASLNLLESNGFFKVADIKDKVSYIIDLRLTPEAIVKMQKKINEHFNFEQKYD